MKLRRGYGFFNDDMQAKKVFIQEMGEHLANLKAKYSGIVPNVLYTLFERKGILYGCRFDVWISLRQVTLQNEADPDAAWNKIVDDTRAIIVKYLGEGVNLHPGYYYDTDKKIQLRFCAYVQHE